MKTDTNKTQNQYALKQGAHMQLKKNNVKQIELLADALISTCTQGVGIIIEGKGRWVILTWSVVIEPWERKLCFWVTDQTSLLLLREVFLAKILALK